MSYLVLARKYRPQAFDEVVGQDHVTRTLANAIDSDRVAHAYLFCGPRGVGKTTAARILAKALNCETGPTPRPCNTCTQCTEIMEGRSLDVLEIDGASNRGIDEVRELRENARYTPTGGGSKVYIIDEVHMLTKEAFNALLKTLEEPPAHVVFVLATTDPFKVPATILSRVQRFDFARISTRAIAQHLEAVLGKEGLEAAPDALSLVARRASGGLRDALSMLDQVLSAIDGPIDREGVENVLGLVGLDFIVSLVDHLGRGDAAAALESLHAAYHRGADLEEVTRSLAAHLRDLYLLRVNPGLTDLVEAPESEIPRYREQGEAFSPEALADCLHLASEAAVELRRHDNPRLKLELTLVEMARVARRVPLGELMERLLKLEQQMGGSPPPEPRPEKKAPPARKARRAASGPAKASPSQAPSAEPPPSGSPSATEEVPENPETGSVHDPRTPAGQWANCLEALKKRNIRLWGTLHYVQAVDVTGDGLLVLRPSPKNPMESTELQSPATLKLLTECLMEIGAEASRVGLEGARSQETPESSQEETTDQRSMGQVFKDEPRIQKVIDMFDGEVLP